MIASATIDGGVASAGVAALYSGSLAHNIKSLTYVGVGIYTVTCSFVPPSADWKRVRASVTSRSSGRIATVGPTAVLEAVTNFIIFTITVVDHAGSAVDTVLEFFAEGI